MEDTEYLRLIAIRFNSPIKKEHWSNSASHSLVDLDVLTYVKRMHVTEGNSARQERRKELK